MTRAEEAAMKAYPKRKDGRQRGYICSDDDVRKIYAQGYRKAKKQTVERAANWLYLRLWESLGPIHTDDFVKEFENAMKR